MDGKLPDSQNRAKSFREVFAFVALMFIEIGAIVTASYFAGDYLKQNVACEWSRILVPSACSLSPTETAGAVEPKVDHNRISKSEWNDTNVLIKRANEQYETIQLRKRFHVELLTGFYKAYSWSILAVLFSAPFAAIALLLLGQAGLTAASTALKATFFATTITAAVAASIPSIFGHQSSISANQALFLAYEDLGNQMKTYYDSGYRNTAKDTTSGTAKTPADSCGTPCVATPTEIRKVLGHIDDEMKRLNQIAIAIDSSKIPAFTINTGKT